PTWGVRCRAAPFPRGTEGGGQGPKPFPLLSAKKAPGNAYHSRKSLRACVLQAMPRFRRDKTWKRSVLCAKRQVPTTQGLRFGGRVLGFLAGATPPGRTRQRPAPPRRP